MTVKVAVFSKLGEKYGDFYALEKSGVVVGPSGSLTLTAEVDINDNPVCFRVYAPGTWSMVIANQAEE